MKNSSLSLWQRRLAKLSFVLVVILLLETYKDMLGYYTHAGIEWVNDINNQSKSQEQVEKYVEKLDKILKNLQYLKEQGKLSRMPDPSFAKDGQDLGHKESPKPNSGGSNDPLSSSKDGGEEEPILGDSYSPVQCKLGMQPKVDWNHKVVPRFPLNPNKFLYPILKNEPIDQLIGLRQAIMLAIKLNRTLALPYFHNHNYGGTSKYNPAIPSVLKINVGLLQRFISVMPLDELNAKCDGKFDVALLTGHINAVPGVGGLMKAQTETRMRFLNVVNMTVGENLEIKFNIPTFPRDLATTDRVSVVPSLTNILTVYPQESARYRCAVHPYPLSALEVEPFTRKALKLPNYRVNLQKMKNDIIYSAIWYYTQPPAFVQDLATSVIEKLINAKQKEGVYHFLCVNYHKHEKGSDADLTLPTLANLLRNLVRKMKEVSPASKISGIYIASPRSKQEKAKDFRQTLKIADRGVTLPILAGDDIIDYWKKEYFRGDLNSPESLCSLLEDDTQDILSFVEAQVCVQSAVFIRSVGSSWAANVQASRIKNPYSSLDMSIKELMKTFARKSN